MYIASRVLYRIYCWREQITDDNLARLMHIAIEAPELTVVDFVNFRHLQGNEMSYYTVN